MSFSQSPRRLPPWMTSPKHPSDLYIMQSEHANLGGWWSFPLFLLLIKLLITAHTSKAVHIIGPSISFQTHLLLCFILQPYKTTQRSPNLPRYQYFWIPKKNLESEMEGDSCDKSMNNSPWLLVGVYTKRWHVLFQSGHIPRQQVRSLVGSHVEGNRWWSIFLFLSLPSSSI